MLKFFSDLSVLLIALKILLLAQIGNDNILMSEINLPWQTNCELIFGKGS